MDLKISGQNFIVSGASSGFGRSVAIALMEEGANVYAIARRNEKLSELKYKYDSRFEYLALDVTEGNAAKKIIDFVGVTEIHGVFINAGGPPAKSFLETELSDWDNAYVKLLRWKVDLVNRLIPSFIEKKYGRILFLESSSVKQPIENLVLSTSLRMSVVGMAKTLSEELSEKGITVNVLAPGSHDTSALDRLIKKSAEVNNVPVGIAKKEFEKKTKVGFLGDPDNLASISTWLLSPHSKFITGQTISVSGGAIKGVFG